MSYKWIVGLIFLMGCSSSKNVVDQKPAKDLSIELISFTKEGIYFDFNFAMINNTDSPVTILKHKGLKEREKNEVVFAGKFYNMEFLPYEVECESELIFVDQEIEQEKVFNMTSDFVTIGSRKKYLFKVKSEDYFLGICNNNITQFNLVMKYYPKKQVFQKEYFSRYKSAKNSAPYFDELRKTHQSIITSDTIIVKL